MIVIKRDGRETQFDKSKVINAIEKAFKNCDYEEIPSCVPRIADEIERLPKAKITVEEIQDTVEKKLMASSYKDVAKAYITYRNIRSLARNDYKELMDAVAEKLGAKDVQNQNANVDEKSFGGRIGEATNVVMQKYALDYIVSPMARHNHLNNKVYIHDLNSYAIGNHNCLSIPFDRLLANGFNTRQTDVRPANSANTACQLTAVIFQLQSLQQFGGVAATHYDWTLVPYVRKSFWKHFKDGMIYIENQPWDLMPDNSGRSITDEVYKNWDGAYRYAMDMTTREVYQGIEGLYHNLK